MNCQFINLLIFILFYKAIIVVKFYFKSKDKCRSD